MFSTADATAFYKLKNMEWHGREVLALDVYDDDAIWEYRLIFTFQMGRREKQVNKSGKYAKVSVAVWPMGFGKKRKHLFRSVWITTMGIIGANMSSNHVNQPCSLVYHPPTTKSNRSLVYIPPYKLPSSKKPLKQVGCPIILNFLLIAAERKRTTVPAEDFVKEKKWKRSGSDASHRIPIFTKQPWKQLWMLGTN